MINKINIIMRYLYFRFKKYSNVEKLKKFQKKKIKKHLKFVTEHSEFYQNFKGKELQEIPIINKKIMMDNFDKLNTVGMNKEESLKFAIECEKTRQFAPRLHDITVGLSSGTSDTRGIFLVSDKEQEGWTAYILSKVIPKHILRKHKIAFFMRADSNLYESLNSSKVQFEFFDMIKPMSENIDKLNEFEPEILVGQPSVLLEICKNVENGKIKKLPQKVISIAEVLEEKDAIYIKKILKLNVIHQVYQCTEGCLATTCEYGNLHLNEDWIYVEKEYLDENRFIPIITDFRRTSQPIIRYRLNDILVEEKKKCKCGSCFTVLKKIEGREDDVFIFEDIRKNGEYIKVFPDFIRRCILFAGNIEEYRVVQEIDNTIIVYVNESEMNKNKIKNEFEKLAAEMKFILPKIEFKDYEYDKKRKLKRVEKIKEK